MQRHLLLIASLVICAISFGQASKFTIDLQIGYLKYKNDFIEFKKPKTLSISTSGCTEIFSLGKSRRHEFGMKVEILISKLSGKDKYLVGKVYYIKKNNDWEEVIKVSHHEQEVRSITQQRGNSDMFIMGGASIDSPDAFDVRLNDDYYLNQ